MWHRLPVACGSHFARATQMAFSLQGPGQAHLLCSVLGDLVGEVPHHCAKGGGSGVLVTFLQDQVRLDVATWFLGLGRRCRWFGVLGGDHETSPSCRRRAKVEGSHGKFLEDASAVWERRSGGSGQKRSVFAWAEPEVRTPVGPGTEPREHVPWRSQWGSYCW